MVRGLPSTPSSSAFTLSFGCFVGVGSEEARLRANHRPPLKLHVRFSRMQLSRRHLLRRRKLWVKNQVDPRGVRQVDRGRQYPQAMMYGFFAQRTDPPHRPDSSSFPFPPGCLRPPLSPTPFRRPSLGHAVLAALQVRFGSPTTDRASLPTSRPLRGLLTRVSPRPCPSSWGPTLFFPPVPSANTGVRWVDENAFASIVQARPGPTLRRPVHHGVAPIDYGPGLLLRPFGFHLAMDTLPSGVLPRNSTSFPLSGQRGITPAFGYGAPHPGARGTLTLLSNVLLRTHYGPLRDPLTARPDSHEVPVDPVPAITAGASRVAPLPLCLHVLATTPA